MIILEFAPRNEPVSCGDCGGTVCDIECPTALAVDHDFILAEIDAFEDDQLQTRLDRRWIA